MTPNIQKRTTSLNFSGLVDLSFWVGIVGPILIWVSNLVFKMAGLNADGRSPDAMSQLPKDSPESGENFQCKQGRLVQ